MAPPSRPKDWSPTGKTPGVESVEVGDLIVIHAPAWFERKDFQMARQDDQLATWNRKSSNWEYADVFTLIGGGDVADSNILPGDITDTIRRIAEDAGLQNAVVWIKPV